jgi:DNA-nicking Smr family endonuclease
MHENDTDEDAFSAAMRDVEPLNHPNSITPKSAWQGPTQTHIQRQLAAEDFIKVEDEKNMLSLGDVPARDPLEVLEWRQEGVQLAVFNKLRKGGYAIEFELDLHQKTVKEARLLVYELINRASAKSWRCILISHGKGQRSETPGRLKSYVARWLTQHPNVIAYCSAQRHRGGVGSVCVLVKKSAASKEINREAYGHKSDL